jgi:hypothetical protein
MDVARGAGSALRDRRIPTVTIATTEAATAAAHAGW